MQTFHNFNYRTKKLIKFNFNFYNNSNSCNNNNNSGNNSNNNFTKDNNTKIFMTNKTSNNNSNIWNPIYNKYCNQMNNMIQKMKEYKIIKQEGITPYTLEKFY